MPERVVSCHACARTHSFDGPVPRGAVCDACASALKCCLACDFYDPSAYNECREPSAERVVDKDRSNYCDYFVPAPPRASPSADTEGGIAAGDDPRAELDKLFGKK